VTFLKIANSVAGLFQHDGAQPRAEPPVGGSSPASSLSRKRPIHWAISIARNLGRLALAASLPGLVATVVAAKMDSWLIGLLTACLASLLVISVAFPFLPTKGRI
jgi:hypothetical protein